MITNRNEAKSMTKHISCDCKCKSNSTTCNSNQKWNNKACQCELKIIVSVEKITVRILAHVFVRMTNIYICYGYCINKIEKHHSNKCYEY